MAIQDAMTSDSAIATSTNDAGNAPTEPQTIADAATVGSFVLIGAACLLVLPAAGYLIYNKKREMTETMTETRPPPSP